MTPEFLPATAQQGDRDLAEVLAALDAENAVQLAEVLAATAQQGDRDLAEVLGLLADRDEDEKTDPS